MIDWVRLGHVFVIRLKERLRDTTKHARYTEAAVGSAKHSTGFERCLVSLGFVMPIIRCRVEDDWLTRRSFGAGVAALLVVYIRQTMIED